MNYQISRHALEQIENREISQQLLKTVLENPQQVFEEDGMNVYQSKVERLGKTQLLRIYVNDSIEPATIVTIYATSKIKKYWRTK